MEAKNFDEGGVYEPFGPRGRHSLLGCPVSQYIMIAKPYLNSAFYIYDIDPKPFN